MSVLLLSMSVYGQTGSTEKRGRMNMSMIRHHFVMRNGVDPQYEDKVNPLKNTTENIAAGKTLFEKHCAACHGLTGQGDGEAGKNLQPPPANVAMFIRMHKVPDSYLYWTIAEGGTPLQTAMPPFKEAMKEYEIWKTILYLREL
jgi:mono/diheme cytochrome c family protein